MGGEDMAYMLSIETTASSELQSYAFYNDFPERIFVRELQGEPVFYLASGIYGFNEENQIIYKKAIYPDFVPNSKFIFTQDDVTWVSKYQEWIAVGDLPGKEKLNINYLHLFDDIQSLYVDDSLNMWVVDRHNSLYQVIQSDDFCKPEFDVFIKSITDSEGMIYTTSNLELGYNRSAILFNFVAPFFIKLNSTRYQYMMEGLEKKWSSWDNTSYIKFPYLPAGKYTMKVRSKNVLGFISKEKTFSFSVKPPFWKTWWFLLLTMLVVTGLIFLTIWLRERKLLKTKRELEIKVQERTAEIKKQKEHITDSIQYASRIQTAIMPPREYIKKVLPEHFILNMPRDIVSGDYYWITEKNNKIIVAAADCTGHGVPGAFLSMLGITFLNEIVIKKENEFAASDR